MNKPLFIFVWLFPVIFFSCSKDSGKSLTASAEVADFEITVISSGELRAKNDITVDAPFELRGIGIYNIKIQDIVAEGTIVKKGDVIATLDKTDLMSRITDARIEVDKLTSEYTNARLDTTLTLRDARDELANLKFSIEEKKLVWEQSEYEVPSIRRQAELDYQKSQNSYEQKLQNYRTKRSQAIAKMQIAGSELSSAQRKLDKLMDVMGKMDILAPDDGMVIYAKDWDGRKRVAGSSFNIWSPEVASLPDLRYMESITFINEVDVRKVKVGQKVRISLDADPDKKLTGKVTSVANIGEKQQNSDAKVFEVLIDIVEVDTTLRPAMSTRNEIVSEVMEKVLQVPIEAVSSNDSVSYVFLERTGSIVMQEVKTGKLSSTHVQILKGIIEDDVVLLTIPEDEENYTLKRLEGEKS